MRARMHRVASCRRVDVGDWFRSMLSAGTMLRVSPGNLEECEDSRKRGLFSFPAFLAVLAVIELLLLTVLYSIALDMDLSGLDLVSREVIAG